MAPGGVIAVHSTISPETCTRLSELATERGVALVDAPVSGGGYKAAKGELLVMAGGHADDVERCRPVFDTFASSVLHLGPVGSGQIAKLLNNLVFIAQIAVAVETFDFADRMHVDRAALAAVLAEGSGGSTAANIISAMKFDLAAPRAHLSVLSKDVGLVLDAARNSGAATPQVLSDLAHKALALLAEDPDTAE